VEIKQLIIGKRHPKNVIEVDPVKMGKLEGSSNITIDEKSVFTEIIAGTEFCGKAIYLDNGFDWILGKTSDNSTILIPMKKIIR